MITFKEYLAERVLNIGFKPEQEPAREKYRAQFHHILQTSYKGVDGGYGGHGTGTPEESAAIHHDISHSLIKATKRGDNITTVNLYKAQHGRKSIASGTDQSPAGKNDFLKNKTDDHKQKRAWAETSGKIEAIYKKIGYPHVPANRAKELTGKEVVPHPDGEHYDRHINGHLHTKIILGHPKK